MKRTLQFVGTLLIALVLIVFMSAVRSEETTTNSSESASEQVVPEDTLPEIAVIEKPTVNQPSAGDKLISGTGKAGTVIRLYIFTAETYQNYVSISSNYPATVSEMVEVGQDGKWSVDLTGRLSDIDGSTYNLTAGHVVAVKAMTLDNANIVTGMSEEVAVTVASAQGGSAEKAETKKLPNTSALPE
ncbi:hypothetical protein [Streptococcus pantholopis]|nr:hypothetical protein [Streptococcus pantholopis]